MKAVRNCPRPFWYGPCSCRFVVVCRVRREVLEMMFYNVLNRKKGFLHYKNVILTKCENVRFSKGVNPWFSSKIWKYFWVINFFEKDLYMMFNYILDKKKLSRRQKCQSKIVWKCPFSLRGYLMIFVQNWTFLLSLTLFEKYQNMIFK